MADRLCPFCGKTNPESAEFCANCQARLVSPEKGAAASQPPAEDNLRNWLSQTGAAAANAIAPEPPASSEEPSTQPPEADAPDWLMRIRDRSKAEQESIEKAPHEASKEDQKNGESTPLSEPPSTDDWLSKLRTSQPAAPLPEIPADEPRSTQVGAGAVEESTEWLKKLEDWKQNSEAKSAAEPKPPLSPTVKPFPKSDLKNLDASKPVEKPTVAAPSEASPAVRPSEKPGSAPGERIPEWLQELESSFPPPEPEKKKESGKPEKKKGTGRLFKPKTGPLEESKSGSSGQIPTPDGEMPQWLSNMTTPAPPTPGVNPYLIKKSLRINLLLHSLLRLKRLPREKQEKANLHRHNSLDGFKRSVLWNPLYLKTCLLLEKQASKAPDLLKGSRMCCLVLRSPLLQRNPQSMHPH